jgi:hypothetical protein
LLKKGAKDNFELDALIEYNISAMLGIFNLWFTAGNRPPERAAFLMYTRKQALRAVMRLWIWSVRAANWCNSALISKTN